MMPLHYEQEPAGMAYREGFIDEAWIAQEE